MLYKELIKTISKENVTKADYILEEILNKEELKNKTNISFLKILNFKYKLFRSKKEPLQYIVGNVNFYGYKYKVNKNVLIPRFETEELVENTIKYIKSIFNKRVSIIDIGTGSGCIGITLKKKLKEVDVTLTDISKKALKVARTNAKGEDITIRRSNILNSISGKYDVIISNPPYISHNEEIMDIVKSNEPNIALYAKNNGLYFYEEIIKTCKSILNDKYLIAFEIGENQAKDIKKIILKYLNDVNIEVKKDLSNRDRMIFITNIK